MTTENETTKNNFNATIGNTVLYVVLWDTELENIGLPSNIFFGFGSELGDIIYRLQKPNDNVRWCIFSIDRNYYIIKQQEVNNEWSELWIKQMNKDLSEAKKYCEGDAFKHYT